MTHYVHFGGVLIRRDKTILRRGVSGPSRRGCHYRRAREARERFLQLARRAEESAPLFYRVHEHAGANPAGVEGLGRRIANGLRLMRRSSQTVFIGETESDVRRRMRDEMSRMGFRVMPEAPMAFTNPQLIQTHLSEARMAVHFAGGQAQERANQTIEASRWSRQVCQGATQRDFVKVESAMSTLYAFLA